MPSQRDPDRLEKWVCANLMNFNKRKARSCAWVGAIQSTNTGWAENGLRVTLRRTMGVD